MKEGSFEQEQTNINSPIKTDLININCQKQSSNNFLLSQSTWNSSKGASKTQQQFLSHSLVKEVITAGRNKSVWHQINKINLDTTLYVKPISKKQGEFRFDNIPPKQRLYSSMCSKKINQINEGLKIFVPLQANNQSINNQITRKRLKTEHKQFKGAQIAVSGLVTYNFHSVKAQRSLGLSKIDHDQIMIKSIAELEKRKNCDGIRNKKIMEKCSKIKYQKYIRSEKSILQEFQGDVSNYLKRMKKEKEQSALIYNQRAKKLTFIKEYMQQQKCSYDDAALIIHKIEQLHQIDELPLIKVKTQIDQQIEFSNRKLPNKRKIVKVRYQTFVD